MIPVDNDTALRSKVNDADVGWSSSKGVFYYLKQRKLNMFNCEH